MILLEESSANPHKTHGWIQREGGGSMFLAHLSRRLMGELIVYQSLRRPSVGPSTISNISSETTGPIKLKFHMETP